MKLYCATSSPSSHAVSLFLACYQQLDVEYIKYELLPIFENRKSSTLSELNANKRVPVLQDEDLSLFESSAILRYLANKYAIKRYGENAESRAKVDVALDWHIANLRPLIKGVIDFMCVYSQDDEDNANFWKSEFDRYLFGTDDMMFVGLPNGIHRLLEVLEIQFLNKNDYVAGSEISIADLPIYTDMLVLEIVLKQDLTKYKKITEWRKRVKATLEVAGGDNLSTLDIDFKEALQELSDLLECPERKDTRVGEATSANDNTSVNDDNKEEESDDETGLSRWARNSIRDEYDGELLTQAQMWTREEARTLEERREAYRCGDKFVELSALKTWSESGRDLYEADDERDEKADDAINAKISLYHGDITRLELDAIVNAANRSMLGGGGIDGAIHRSAGEKLYCECCWLNGAETGECKITKGYNLPAKHVLHCVGPVGENREKLEDCYNNALSFVHSHGLKTIAFCGISTGIYGYPLKAAANVALQTVRKWLEVEENRNAVDRIVFVTFLERELDVYEHLLAKYFPLAWSDAEIAEMKKAEAERQKDENDNDDEDNNNDDDDDDDDKKESEKTSSDENNNNQNDENEDEETPQDPEPV